MKKPALRKNRFKPSDFIETNWTKSSKNIGEYIFRRISIDQSDKKLQEIRPRHILSKMIVGSKEIQTYVNDYLLMTEKKSSSSARGVHLDDIERAYNINVSLPNQLPQS
ncbi:MAG: hypothetical protein ACKVHA_02165 [Fidelibacterota bacterium]|jgi:hypothetical protein|tara:strand:- start:1440 stop:1766 length:327 start_codon:yes stop_codon:yes gene_type:complete